jgi:CheY-like chemotaxis protein
MTRPRILIVENEKHFQEYLKTKLEQLGYTVVNSVSTAMDAIILAEGTIPDLVLMDNWTAFKPQHAFAIISTYLSYL